MFLEMSRFPRDSDTFHRYLSVSIFRVPAARAHHSTESVRIRVTFFS